MTDGELEPNDSYSRFDPRRFIAPAVVELRPEEETAEMALRIGEWLSENQMWWSGKSPRLVGATALYLAALLTASDIEQQEVADVFDIHERSIRLNRPKLMNELRESDMISV